MVHICEKMLKQLYKVTFCKLETLKHQTSNIKGLYPLETILCHIVKFTFLTMSWQFSNFAEGGLGNSGYKRRLRSQNGRLDLQIGDAYFSYKKYWRMLLFTDNELTTDNFHWQLCFFVCWLNNVMVLCCRVIETTNSLGSLNCGSLESYSSHSNSLWLNGVCKLSFMQRICSWNAPVFTTIWHR